MKYIKTLILKIKQWRCKHTYIPATKIAHYICIDCSKLKNISDDKK